MVTKTLTITEDAYLLLKQRKAEGESFSEVIRKLALQKGDASELYGAWADMTDEETEEMKRSIEDMDKKSTRHMIKKVSR